MPATVRVDCIVITPNAGRQLICGRCSAQWPFGAFTCPFCANDDRARITYTRSDDFTDARGTPVSRTGVVEHALVVGADVMSSIIDYTDRTTCVLFGDGAGAVVVEPAVEEGLEIIGFEHEIDGGGGPALQMPAGGSLNPASHETVEKRMHFVKQDGQAVFKFAVRKTEEISLRVLEKTGYKAEDLALFVSHQANRRIIEAAADRLGLPPEKVVINLDRYGNTTAGTIPLALADAAQLLDQALRLVRFLRSPAG